jgi:hypothetical protein
LDDENIRSAREFAHQAVELAMSPAPWSIKRSKPYGGGFALIIDVMAALENESYQANERDESRALACLLRDIFGLLPFRRRTVYKPLPAWISPATRAIAEDIYENKRFERLPILGQALKKAGCDDPDMLRHCDCLGPHGKGCWVVDLLVEKD